MLDETVIDALTFFEKNKPPQFHVSRYTLPFVVGSGNALNAGKIIFSKHAAIFADESNFQLLMKSYTPVVKTGVVKQAVIISASGEKDAVWEVELAKKNGLQTTLLTCAPSSSAAQIADHVLVFKSIAEPYTYNTSTYLGMILSSTHENPKRIRQYVHDIKLPARFDTYTSYAFILPDAYSHIAPMINIKSDELFGPHLMLRACSQGHARHAKFVHPWHKELVISIGESNTHFGHPRHRWDLKLPASTNFATVMSTCYYLCGKIQSVKPQYFKKNIPNFCKDYGPKAYGRKQHFEVIVPANI